MDRDRLCKILKFISIVKEHISKDEVGRIFSRKPQRVFKTYDLNEQDYDFVMEFLGETDV